jgi:hypothetical protein
LAKNLGLDGVATEHVASPFNYAENALLYVPDNFPERNDPGAEAAIVEELVGLITAAGGRTLALFTNRSVMMRVAEAVAPRLDTEVLVQGSFSRARLIEPFAKATRPVSSPSPVSGRASTCPGTRSVSSRSTACPSACPTIPWPKRAANGPITPSSKSTCHARRCCSPKESDD